MTHAQILFAVLLLIIFCVILIFDFKFDALKDSGADTISRKPYSFGKVQLSWWTVIIFSAFAACLLVKKLIPNLDPSLLYLLGISGGTTLLAKVVDAKANQITSVIESKGFFADILNYGDIHRLQTMLFNVAVGGWFILQVAHNLIIPLSVDYTIDKVLPAIPTYILVLLSVSNVIYLGGKTQEN